MSDTFIRVWKGLTKRGRCRKCGAPVQWVTTDAGRMLPFAAGAVPVREDLHPRLQVLFQVFDAATAFHSTVCRKRVVDSKSPRPPQ